jgi:hypothetical protein
MDLIAMLAETNLALTRMAWKMRLGRIERMLMDIEYADGDEELAEAVCAMRSAIEEIREEMERWG